MLEIRTTRGASAGALAAAALVMTGCGATAASTPDQAVKDQVGTAQDAVVALLKDHPSLGSDGVTRKLLASAGYHVTKQAEVWFDVSQGRYCVWGVDAAKDGQYGLTATHVWAADDTNATVRSVPVNKNSGSPDFGHIDPKTGKWVAYPGTCGQGGADNHSVLP